MTTSRPSHPPNLLLILKSLQPLIEMLPPLEQQRIADQLEPGRELQGRVGEHVAEFLRGDVAGGLDFVGVVGVVDGGFDEKNVINYKSGVVSGMGLVGGETETYSRARPIYHRWELCSGCGSGNGISRWGFRRL